MCVCVCCRLFGQNLRQFENTFQSIGFYAKVSPFLSFVIQDFFLLEISIRLFVHRHPRLSRIPFNLLAISKSTHLADINVTIFMIGKRKTLFIFCKQFFSSFLFYSARIYIKAREIRVQSTKKVAAHTKKLWTRHECSTVNVEWKRNDNKFTQNERIFREIV